MTKAQNILNNNIKKIMEVKQLLNQYESIEVVSHNLVIDNSFFDEILEDCKRFKNDMELFVLVEQSGSVDKFSNIFEMIILKDKMLKELNKVKLIDDSKNSQKFYEYGCDFIIERYENAINKNQLKIFDDLIFNEL